MNTKTEIRVDLESIRRACDNGPASARRLLSPPQTMKPRQAAQILDRGIALCNQPEVTRECLRGNTISWRLEREGWTSVRWVTATEYAPGFVRLRNDIWDVVPKVVWPFPLPKIREFELTFHWEEIREELGREVLRFCNSLTVTGCSYDWQLFAGEETYPQYAWTPRARRIYAQNRG